MTYCHCKVFQFLKKGEALTPSALPHEQQGLFNWRISVGMLQEVTKGKREPGLFSMTVTYCGACGQPLPKGSRRGG